MTLNKNVQILVHNWNPNGTNDIEILVDGESVDCIPEALFGLNIGSVGSNALKLLRTLERHIGVNVIS